MKQGERKFSLCLAYSWNKIIENAFIVFLFYYSLDRLFLSSEHHLTISRGGVRDWVVLFRSKLGLIVTATVTPQKVLINE